VIVCGVMTFAGSFAAGRYGGRVRARNEAAA
jgi:hypothetical protein